MMQIWNENKQKWSDCLKPKIKTEKETETMMIAERFEKIYAEDNEWYYYQTDYKKKDSSLFRIKKINQKCRVKSVSTRVGQMLSKN